MSSLASSSSFYPEIIPSCQQIYRYRNTDGGPNGTEASLTSYYPGLNIRWSSKYKWNVYIGDIIAIKSTSDDANISSVQEIEGWVRYNDKKQGGKKSSAKKKKSDHDDSHWKIGLVLALTQVTYASKIGSSKFECTVQWLYKCNDKNEFKTHITNQGSFRPTAIPYLLLNGKGHTSSIDVARILPVRITMLTSQEFQKINKHNFARDDDDDDDDLDGDGCFIDNVKFFCSKVLTKAGSIVNYREQDVWAEFNIRYQHGISDVQRGKPPKPLQEAWTEWKPTTEIAELLQNLCKGFKEASKKKLKEKNEATKRRAEQRRQLEVEEDRATNKKPKKTTRFIVPGPEGEEKKETTSNKPTTKEVQALPSAMKKPTPSNKKKQKRQPIETNDASNDSSNNDDDDDGDDGIVQVTPLSHIIFSTNGKKKGIDYYDSVEIAIDPGNIMADDKQQHRKRRHKSTTTAKFVISVGDIVAIQSEDSVANDFSPFCVPWGVTQLLAISKHRHRQDDDSSSPWKLQVRWFFRHEEMNDDQQEQIRRLGYFDKNSGGGLMESLLVTENCPIEAVLPATIRFVKQQHSQGKDKRHSTQNRTTTKKNGLPLIYVNCHHYWDGTKAERLQDDWQNYHQMLCKSLPDHLTRGLDLLPKELAKRYRKSISVVVEEGDAVNSKEKERAGSTKRKAPTPLTMTDDVSDTYSNQNQKKANKKRRTIQVNPCSQVIHKKKGKRGRHYYQSVEIKVDKRFFDEGYKSKNKIPAKKIVVSVGDTIALQDYEDAMVPALLPFCVGWHVAQVISIYQTNTDACSWELGIRKFFRYGDLDADLQESVKSMGFTKQSGLLECMNSAECSIDWVLPARIQISGLGEGNELARTAMTSIKDGLPLVRFLCCHLQDSEKPHEIHPISDWDDMNSEEYSSVPGPLERGFRSIPPTVAKKYIQEMIRGNDDSMDVDSDGDKEEEEVDAVELQVSPLSSKPTCERWERKFYDGVRMDIEQKCMDGIAPRTKQWTIKVGYVVPIQVDQPPLEGVVDTTNCWYPYVTSWMPAQIISIYKAQQSGEWMMQIRWFNRYRDLLSQQRKDLDSLDRPHVVFETEEYDHVSVVSALPGRVVVVSHPLDNWDIKTSTLTGLPIMPRLCSHICLDEDIDDALDWTGYDLNLNSIPDPLTRGLLSSPRNRDNKDWVLMLSRYYKKSIRMRSNDPDQDVFRDWSSPKASLVLKQVKLDPSDVSTSIGPRLLESVVKQDDGGKQEFYISMKIALPLQYIASPSKPLRRAKKSCFSFSLGDVVCYYDANANTRADSVLVKNLSRPWHPFYVPWSFGQVLSIYKEPAGEGADNETYLEMRRFLRLSELPGAVQDILPSETDGGKREEVLESDLIADRVPAIHVLGSASIFLANHYMAASGANKNEMVSTKVACRCRFFFLSEMNKIQPLFCSGLLSRVVWFDRLKWRGYSLSKRINKSPALRDAIAAFEREGRQLDPCGLLIGGEKTTGMHLEPLSTTQETHSVQHSYRAAEISPNWSAFVQSDILYNVKDRERQKWNIQVGDIVAVKEFTSSQHSGSTFPFLMPWTPCQILDIYTNDTDAQDDNLSEDNLFFKLGSMKIVPEPTNGYGIPLLTADPSPQEKDAKTSDLLGPLCARAWGEGDGWDCDWEKNQNHLPFAPVFMDGTIEQNRAPGWQHSLQSGPSNHATEATSIPTHAVWTTVEPFHVDVSQHRLYYSEFDLYSEIAVSGNNDPQRWKIRMGDPVMVHTVGPKRFPMPVNWQVAEIVAIWKRASSTDELKTELHSDKVTGSRVHVEIRWFSERHEIVGVNKAATIDENELFETDHLDELDAVESILAPVNVSADPESKLPSLDTRAPTLQPFFCRRYWSPIRKSLIPCGSQIGRQKRGWLHSKHVTPEMQRKIEKKKEPVSLDQTTMAIDKKEAWRHNFQQVIKKLTLKDASKGAYERGETLVGREKELQQLLSFFRSAILGDATGAFGQKSSLFIAGPPGVGKTACIRAAIARLRTEQEQGNLPNFDFIPLNGMEMQKPFDAYVRLWEELTGRKHVGEPTKAGKKLEAYFTGSDLKSSASPSSISVVLLDEIDYLITSKQTVMYDFFDWPKRAAEMCSPRRLVVVGISNTLNLTEQLLPSVQSRIGNERCIFKAYNLNDVINILTSKIKEASPYFSVFEDDAIEFAAKKTAALSGDIRRAFQICRTAAEHVLATANDQNNVVGNVVDRKVKIKDVQKASRESFNMALVTAVSFSTPFQALILITLASLCRTTGREVGGFDIKDITTKMDAIAGASGDDQYLPAPSFGETIRLLNDLGEQNLITLKTVTSTSTSFRASSGGNGGAWPIAALAVDESTIIRGLKDTPYIELAEKNLPPQF